MRSIRAVRAAVAIGVCVVGLFGSSVPANAEIGVATMNTYVTWERSSRADAPWRIHIDGAVYNYTVGVVVEQMKFSGLVRDLGTCSPQPGDDLVAAGRLSGWIQLHYPNTAYSQRQAFELVLRAPLPNTSWPGPAPTRFRIFRPGEHVAAGELELFMRAGGACPPAGSPYGDAILVLDG